MAPTQESQKSAPEILSEILYAAGLQALRGNSPEVAEGLGTRVGILENNVKNLEENIKENYSRKIDLANLKVGILGGVITGGLSILSILAFLMVRWFSPGS